MKRILLVMLLLVGCTIFAFSQTRPTLGVLPFTGGMGDEGDVIASLFLEQRKLRDAFNVVPRNLALNAIFTERQFQMSDLTDPDTFVSITRMLNADYVLSGSITRLGGRSLLITSIIRVESFEQVAGYYITYLNIEEVIGLLPYKLSGLINATHITLGRTAELPELAVAPFSHHGGVTAHDAETLAQLLAIELLNTGRYVVLPRLSIIQAALREQGFQMLGHTDDAGMASLGRAINANYVLSGSISRLGAANLFMAQILNVEDGRVIEADSVQYRAISEGADLMGKLAILLTIPPGPERDRLIALHQRDGRRVAGRRIQEREARRIQREAAAEARRIRLAPILANAQRNTLGGNFLVSWGGGEPRPAFLFAIGGYWSPIPFTAIGIEGRAGWHRSEQDQHGLYHVQALVSASPALGFVFPLGGGRRYTKRIFTNAMLDLGNFGPWNGLITNWATPSFDIGLEFSTPTGFSMIQYRGILFEGGYANAIGISIGVRF